MGEIPGIIRPELQALPQIKDRMTFLYLEHCTLGRQDGAITVTDEKGIVHIPCRRHYRFAFRARHPCDPPRHGTDGGHRRWRCVGGRTRREVLRPRPSSHDQSRVAPAPGGVGEQHSQACKRSAKDVPAAFSRGGCCWIDNAAAARPRGKPRAESLSGSFAKNRCSLEWAGVPAGGFFR